MGRDPLAPSMLLMGVLVLEGGSGPARPPATRSLEHATRAPLAHLRNVRAAPPPLRRQPSPLAMDDCVKAASTCGVFQLCSEATLRKICARASAVELPKGAVVYREGELQTEMLIVAAGKLEGTKRINGQEHLLGTITAGASVGANHAITQDPAAVTYRCVSPVTAFALQSSALADVLADPAASREVMFSLSKEIRRQASLLQTPLLEQHAKPTPWLASSIAAGIESFYRSGMNSLLNARLTGQPVAQLFPNMHMQIPTRVVYINGFKGLRHLLEKNVDADQFDHPQAVRLVEAVTPGIVMTPISGLLEAFNAGHMNPESLTKRWIRGFWPRCLREVIFGVGLNQLSDYFEERLALTSSAAMNNAIGSLAAGVVSGYFSHVPHNLSTMKLMNPQKPYSAHMADFIKHSESRVPASVPKSMRSAAATALALLFPRGLTVRTTQIVGSFIILNGTINSLKDVDIERFFNRY